MSGFLDKISEKAEKKLDQMSSYVASAKDKLEEKVGVSRSPQSIEEIVETVNTHLKAGRYKEAGRHVAHEIRHGIRMVAGMDSPMQKTAESVVAFLEELPDTIEKNVADNLKKLGEQCGRYTNSFMKEIGAVCK